tara:strand:- start:48640 stop:51099 length:2460 start_codon:yes stop_codon:yes gene_type:complete
MSEKPVVIITGAEGNIGTALTRRLRKHYRVVGMDQPGTGSDIDIDLTSEASVKLAFNTFRDDYGDRIAAVVHLAAYFDFTGEKSPLYDEVNVNGTRRLMDALCDFQVERLVYSGTMLVHRPAAEGDLVNETSPVEPKWAYPESKAETEAVIAEYKERIPHTLLHLAGLYDEKSAVPTLTHQIARIYERDMKSQLYAGDLDAGQAFVHLNDMLEAFACAVEKRSDLPPDTVILVGEEEVMSYRELQNALGELIHGEKEWRTYVLPEALAKAGAWVEEKSEPLVPDAIDKGEKPFIRPFLIDLGSDHYELDISRARDLLGWEPAHFIGDELAAMVEELKKDPLAWYERNGIRPPDWMLAADEKNRDPEALRKRHERNYRQAHANNLWGHLLNTGLGAWLLVGWLSLGYESEILIASDIFSGLAIIVLSLLSLSWRLPLARWMTAAVGLWVVSAPLLLWAPTAASYLNGTLVGSMVIGFSVLTRPAPGVSPAAALTGPTIPPGWQYSPSSWFQRLPIIILAFVGFFIAHYLGTYQLEHVDGVWDPFFGGAIADDGKNGTEEIITSSISEAWPVPDAGVGALTYLLEILTGIIGSTRRWRTMPWLVLLFGIMIVPLGAVSISFIIIQPILLDTWCTLCLIAAAAMLIQIPYSIDELVATGQFLARRKRAGQPLLRVLLFGDTDEGRWQANADDDFQQHPLGVINEMLTGGMSLAWGLVGCTLLGAWMMLTPLALGVSGNMLDANFFVGALVITVSVSAFAEAARALRFLNVLLGTTLVITAFLFGESVLAIALTALTGIAIIALSIPRGPVRSTYGTWDRFIF